jgi:hypothetical protein
VLSFVRSNGTKEVGFLGDKRRINVAVTRARRHLAVVCDVDTCSSDPFIRGLIEHIGVVGEHRSVFDGYITELWQPDVGTGGAAGILAVSSGTQASTSRLSPVKSYGSGVKQRAAGSANHSQQQKSSSSMHGQIAVGGVGGVGGLVSSIAGGANNSSSSSSRNEASTDAFRHAVPAVINEVFLGTTNSCDNKNNDDSNREADGGNRSRNSSSNNNNSEESTSLVVVKVELTGIDSAPLRLDTPVSSSSTTNQQNADTDTASGTSSASADTSCAAGVTSAISDVLLIPAAASSVAVTVLRFPPSLSSHQRRLVHEIAEEMGVPHRSTGDGGDRYIELCPGGFDEEVMKEEVRKESASGGGSRLHRGGQNTAAATATATATTSVSSATSKDVVPTSTATAAASSSSSIVVGGGGSSSSSMIGTTNKSKSKNKGKGNTTTTAAVSGQINATAIPTSTSATTSATTSSTSKGGGGGGFYVSAKRAAAMEKQRSLASTGAAANANAAIEAMSTASTNATKAAEGAAYGGGIDRSDSDSDSDSDASVGAAAVAAHSRDEVNNNTGSSVAKINNNAGGRKAKSGGDNVSNGISTAAAAFMTRKADAKLANKEKEGKEAELDEMALLEAAIESNKVRHTQYI